MFDLIRDVTLRRPPPRQTPMFTLATLLTLALGIGANTAIFSVVDSVLLKPLPFNEPDRLVGLWQTAPGVNIKDLNASGADYVTYREESRTLSDVAIFNGAAVTITGQAEPERVDGFSTTFRLLPMLDIRPVYGRSFAEKDNVEGSPEVVMLGHGYWQRRFGGDPGVVGRRLTIDGSAREVIGILPAGFWFMDMAHDVVLPIRFDRTKVRLAGYNFRAVGRLRPGVTLDQVNADVARMIRVAFTKFPPPEGMSLKMMEDARLGPNVRPLIDDLVGDIGKSLWVVMATIGIVLLIACANVANLLLVRTEGRAQELAVRAAIGAGRGRLAREMLIESLVLSILGGALGLGVAMARAAPRAGDDAGRPAARRPRRRRRHGAGVHLRPVGRRRPAVRLDPGAEAQPHRSVAGLARGRPQRQRRPRPQRHPQHADDRPGGAGPGAADWLGPDDPHLPVDASGPARLHQPRHAADAAGRDPARLGRR